MTVNRLLKKSVAFGPIGILSMRAFLEGATRGLDQRSGELFSYVDLEKRVRLDHPLRAIRVLTDSAPEALSNDFAALYSGRGRPSIAPEMMLRAMLFQTFYSVPRSVS